MFTVRVRHILSVLLMVVLVMPALVIHLPALAQGDDPPQGLRPDAPPYAVRGPHWVGTRQFVIDPDSERPIPLFVWYPALNADSADDSYTYSIDVKWEPAPELDTVVYGHALLDAAPDLSGAPYPVVVLSPGFGTNVDQYTYLIEHLASYGFVVLGVEHLEGVYLMDEDTFRDAPPSYALRPSDVRRALDYAEGLTASEGALEGLLDLEKVAVAGHSSGGYTALAAAGARVDTEAMHQRCEAGQADGDPNAVMCDDFVPHEAEIAALAGFDPMPEGLWPSMGDSRVDAIIPMAGESYMYDQAGLAQITVPVLAMQGTLDYLEWGAGPTFEYAASAQKALVAFEGAEHGIFGNGCDAMPWLVDVDMWWMCIDPIWDRHRTNDLINHFTTAFLLDVLKGDEEAHAALAPDAVQFPGITYEAQGFNEGEATASVTTAAPVAQVGTPVLSAEQIIGTWRYQSDAFHFQFHADGTFRANQSRAGLDSDNPEDLGIFSVENGVLTLTSGETTRYCSPGDVGVYTIYLTEKEELALVLREDGCYMREAPPTAPQLFNLLD
jgi:predicted dienelactone hydrolase